MASTAPLQDLRTLVGTADTSTYTRTLLTGAIYAVARDGTGRYQRTTVVPIWAFTTGTGGGIVKLAGFGGGLVG